MKNLFKLYSSYPMFFDREKKIKSIFWNEQFYTRISGIHIQNNLAQTAIFYT